MTATVTPVRSRRGLFGVVLVLAGGVAAAVFFARGRGPKQFLERPATFVREIAKSEAASDKVAAAIKSTFIKGMRDRNWTLAASGLSGDFRAKFPEPGAGELVPDEGLTIRNYTPGALAELDRDAFVKVMRSHVEPWSLIERTTWRTFEFLLDPSEKRAFAALHFQMAGPLPNGRREDLRATVQTEFVLEDSGWKMRRLALVEGNRVSNPNLPFEDVTDATGLHFNESEENRKHLTAIVNNLDLKYHGGLSIVDWNRDGFADILATWVHRHAVLFLNDGKGGFDRQDLPFRTPKERGLFVLYVDLDNDGREELVNSEVTEYEGTKAYLGIYTRPKGEWVHIPRALEFPIAPREREVEFATVQPMDIDGNGFVDLFFGGYQNNQSDDDPSQMVNSIAAYNGADNHLFMNHGALKFTEESEARGIHGTQYTLASKFFDIDGDGDQDLLECNDFGPDILYENTGKGMFKEAKGHRFAQDCTYTMGISIADWDNTGDWSIYISNMYSHAGNRIVPLAEGFSDEIRKTAMMAAAGNQMFEYDRARKEWRETGVERGVFWGDWAWSCLFCDLDNDTDKEIFVANGFTSNDDAKSPDW